MVSSRRRSYRSSMILGQIRELGTRVTLHIFPELILCMFLFVYINHSIFFFLLPIYFLKTYFMHELLEFNFAI